MLEQRLDLRTLHLGHLSWHWAGYTWLQADDVSFTGQKGQIHVSRTNLSIRLSTWEMLTGHLRPLSISVRQGAIILNIPKRLQIEKWPFLSGKLDMKDTALSLTYGAYKAHFKHLNLHMDGLNRGLSAHIPGLNLDLSWNKTLEPMSLHVRFHNLGWLPKPWRIRLQGKFSGKISLKRDPMKQLWRLQASLSSDDGARIIQARGHPRLAFNHIEINARLHMKGNSFHLARLELKKFNWRSGANALHMAGEWQNKMLHMKIGSGTIQLPILATWLKPLGNAAWRQWLASIQKGEIRQINGEIAVAQSSPWRIPGTRQWEQSRFHMHARIDDASIPLATPNEQLRHLQATADMDERGLRLRVDHVTLPYKIGKTRGTMTIHDWHHIVFDIDGSGSVDIARYQAWRGTALLPQLMWKKSRATAHFSLLWPLGATNPQQGTVELTPDTVWQAELAGRKIRLSGGILHWDTKGHLKLESMRIEHDIFAGTLNMDMHKDQKHAWQLSKLSLQTVADFSKLADQYHIPLDSPAGKVKAHLTFDHSWHLNLDFHNAAWRHLLGSDKAVGEPYSLTMSGGRSGNGVKVTNIESSGSAPTIRGNGILNSNRLDLHLRTIQTPAFAGSINIMDPFNDSPLEISIHSKFLDRMALPNHIPAMLRLTDGSSNAARAWVLRGFFSRVQWNAVSMRDVHVRFTSSRQGIGSLEAKKLDAAQLSVSNVRAFFHLPGNGAVDIRQLSAKLLGQTLSLSVMLSPEPGNALRWKGFASVSGDFSELIHRLDASRLFAGGTVHALWSGEGLLDPKRPWWNGMKGRLRLRSDDGRLLLEDSTMTKLLAALNLTDLPKFLTGKRKDISGKGMFYKRLQLEANVNGEIANVRQLAIHASALDITGSGKINLANGHVNLYMAVRPLQNIDTFLRMIPLLRDIILGPANSVFRKVYHVYGPLYNAKIEPVSSKTAGLPEPGLIERLIHLPGKWFGSEKPLQQTRP